MSGTIKGITIELSGDTKGLDSALKQVTSQSVALGKDLKTVNQLLKLDPGNAELVAQKQQILAQAVESTAKNLKFCEMHSLKLRHNLNQERSIENSTLHFRRSLSEQKSGWML